MGHSAQSSSSRTFWKWEKDVVVWIGPLAQSTSPLTICRWAKRTGSSDRTSAFNQHVHVRSVDRQNSTDRQKGQLHSFDMSTYLLEIGKDDEIV